MPNPLCDHKGKLCDICWTYVCGCDYWKRSGSWVGPRWLCWNCKQNIGIVMTAFDVTGAKAAEVLRSLR